MVSTPQRSYPCMTGSALKPCTTASLWMTTAVSCPLMREISSRMQFARLKRLLGQLPGCAGFDRSVLADDARAADADDGRQSEFLLFGERDVLPQHVDQP